MLRAFTRNYHDNSTDAGFQFTFYCDICKDGIKSSFVQSATFKRRGFLRDAAHGANMLGSVIGGRASRVGRTASMSSNMLSRGNHGKSPEWQKEHEKAFERAQNEAKQHFKRCPHCNKYVCDHCWNEDEGLCVSCAPRQEIYVAQARAQAMKRNIDAVGSSATVWQGAIESKTTICTACGKPAGTGKFCNNCGASMALTVCGRCGASNAQTVRFCNNCGENLQATAQASSKCPACGKDNAPGTKFCGDCGNKLA